MSELDYRRWTMIVRLMTLAVLIGIFTGLAIALPVLVHAAHIYITMYG